jgi:2-haloacid dehalogenase
VLAKLWARGVRIGIITDCSIVLGRRAAAVCEAACSQVGEGGGVEPTADGFETPFRFDAVVTSEEAGFYKPDVRAYEAVLEKLGIRAAEAVFVAGSAADVPGTSGAGIPRVVWHNRVGLVAKDGAPGPLREGRTFGEALEGFS